MSMRTSLHHHSCHQLSSLGGFVNARHDNIRDLIESWSITFYKIKIEQFFEILQLSQNEMAKNYLWNTYLTAVTAVALVRTQHRVALFPIGGIQGPWYCHAWRLRSLPGYNWWREWWWRHFMAVFISKIEQILKKRQNFPRKIAIKWQ